LRQNNRAENSHQVVRRRERKLRKQGFAPKKVVTDKLRSYGAAFLAALQITGLRPAIPEHACRGPQHIQPSAASCLSLNSPDLPIRCGCAMAQRNRRRIKPSLLRPLPAETAQLDNALAGHTGVVVAVAFSPDGTLVLTGSLDNTARLWDVPTATAVATLAKVPPNPDATLTRSSPRHAHDDPGRTGDVGPRDC
jgi:hypothetical protein